MNVVLWHNPTDCIALAVRLWGWAYVVISIRKCWIETGSAGISAEEHMVDHRRHKFERTLHAGETHMGSV